MVYSLGFDPKLLPGHIVHPSPFISLCSPSVSPAVFQLCHLSKQTDARRSLPLHQRHNLLRARQTRRCLAQQPPASAPEQPFADRPEGEGAVQLRHEGVADRMLPLYFAALCHFPLINSGNSGGITHHMLVLAEIVKTKMVVAAWDDTKKM